jgi:hypothetical protein
MWRLNPSKLKEEPLSAETALAVTKICLSRGYRLVVVVIFCYWRLIRKYKLLTNISVLLKSSSSHKITDPDKKSHRLVVFNKAPVQLVLKSKIIHCAHKP